MYFPLVLNLSVVLEKRVDKIRTEEKDKRPDLFALAMGCVRSRDLCNKNFITEIRAENQIIFSTTKSGVVFGFCLHFLCQSENIVTKFFMQNGVCVQVTSL